MSQKNWPDPSDVNRVLDKMKSDAAFKAQLLRDANAALKGIGVQVPQGLTVKVHENDAHTMNFILPAQSQGSELSDETLGAAVGGIVRRAQK